MSQRSSIDNSGCKFPFYLCEYLKSLLISTPPNDGDTSIDKADRRGVCVRDTNNVIKGISEKFKLFMAYQASYESQSMSISNPKYGI